MAKKHRERVWYIGLTKDEADMAFLNRRLTKDIKLFDKFSLAFGVAASKRLKPVRDKAGQLILDENGYAKLPEPGRVTVIGIKGRALDWKRIVKAPRNTFATVGIKGDFIEPSYVILLNKQTLDVVLEETDESYEVYLDSPLVQAGQHTALQQTAAKAVKELAKDGTITTEESLSAIES